METNKDQRRIERFLKTWRWPVRLFFRLRFCHTCKTETVPDGPFLLYANHVTDLDPVFVAAAIPVSMTYVAGENAQRMGLLSKVIRRYASTIDRVKGASDSACVLKILRTLRAGQPVCMFPSGNRSYCGKSTEIPLSAAKLAKSAHVPLITYKLTGGYMTSPRWADRMRRGKMHGEIVRVYTVEELAGMPVEELHRQISADLYEDAYAAEPIPYKGKRLAERLETMLYLCPRCGCADKLTSRDDTFSCACGLSMRIDETGRFQGENLPFAHPGEWDDWQQERMQQIAAAAADAPVFSDEGQQLYRIADDHRLLPVTAGKMTMSGRAFTLGKYSVPLSALEGLGLTQQEQLSFGVAGERYVIRSDHHRCGKKYYDLYRYRQKGV